MTQQEKSSSRFEELKVKGNQLVDRVREIIEEGNARRVIIKKEGRTVMEFPLSVGVGGATAALVLAPTLAAIGAFAALVTDVSIVIERDEGHAEVLEESEATAPPETDDE